MDVSRWAMPAATLVAFVATVAWSRHRATQQRQTKHHVVDDVRHTCAMAAQQLKHLVWIDFSKLDALSKSELLSRPPQWDEFDWHCCVSKHGTELTARYVFVLDALNYCFWPAREKSNLEYENLARGLRKACDAGETLLNLQECSADRLKGWLEAPHEFPLFDTRLSAIRALGRAFLKHGDAVDWLRESNNSAATLVDLVQERLESFKDETYLGDHLIRFYKRAQILVADIWAAFGQSNDGLGGFRDIEKLTMFADYRVPQLLRDMGAIHYSPELEALVDEKKEIPRDSPEEIAIRAATVFAVELMRKASGGKLTSVEVDWILWQKGEAQKEKLRPHHRTITTCY